MVEDFQSLIKQLKEEFVKLKKATDYIDQSKEQVKNTIYFTSDVTDKLIKKFDSVIWDLNKAFEQEKKTNKKQVENFRQDLLKTNETVRLSAEKSISTLTNNLTIFEDLSKQTKGFIAKIEGINFPERLDKLEGNIDLVLEDFIDSSSKVNLESHSLLNEIKEINFAERFEELQQETRATVNQILSLNNTLEAEIENKIQGFVTQIGQVTNKLDKLDIPGNFKILKSDFSKETKAIIANSDFLTKKTEELIKEIRDVSISHRLDKIDLTIAGINQGIQSLMQRSESFERNIKDELCNKTNDILSKVDYTSNELVNHIKVLDKSAQDTFATMQNEINQLSSENKTLKTLVFVSIGISIIGILTNIFI